jgi:GT2 family glycosyltransferase
MPQLSVVIPNYNGRKHLERLLPSLVGFAPADAELLVVDDASTDDSVAWIRQHHPRVRIVERATNGGFCAACNAGLAAATGEIVCALNNDTEILPGWFDAVAGHFDDPAVGSVAPLVLKMADPSTVDSAGQEYHGCGWAYDRGHGQRLNPQLELGCEVFGPTMSCAFYRAEALRKTGLLPMEFGAYFEDTDLAFRLRWAGYACRYEPRCRLLHVGSATYASVKAGVVRNIARNEELVFFTNLSGPALLAGIFPHAAFQSVRLLRHIATGRWRPFWKGKTEALISIQRILERRAFARSLGPRRGSPRLALQWTWKVFTNGMEFLKRRTNSG